MNKTLPQIILEAEKELNEKFGHLDEDFDVYFYGLKSFLSSQISKALSEVLQETLLNTERVLPENENQMDWCNGYNTCLNIVKANIKNLDIEIK